MIWVIALIGGTLLFAAWVLYDGAELTFRARIWLAARIARMLEALEEGR